MQPVPTDPSILAERVAAVVTAHPAVARLHGGTFNDIATYVPGGRLTGVRIGDGGPVELALVVRLGHRIPDVVDSLRREVSLMCGGAAVDITVADIDDGAVVPIELARPGASNSPAHP